MKEKKNNENTDDKIDNVIASEIKTKQSYEKTRKTRTKEKKNNHKTDEEREKEKGC